MTQPNRSRTAIWAAGLLAAIAASAVNTVWYLVTRPLGVSYEVTAPGQTGAQQLPVAVLAVVSFVAVLIGTFGLWLLRRWHRGVLVWRGLVIAVYVISLGNPISSASELSTVACLILAHTVVAAAALMGPGRRA